MLYTLGTCTFNLDSLRAVNKGEQGTHMVWVHIYLISRPDSIATHVLIEKYQQFLCDWMAYTETGKIYATASELALPAGDIVETPVPPNTWESVDQRGQRWDARMEMGLKSDWLGGMTIPQLAHKYQRTEDAVKRRLRRLGVSTKDDPRVTQAKSFLRK